VFNYTRSRQIDRPQVQDIINNSNIFTNYIELSGDGKVGRDVCIRGGIVLYKGLGCVVLGNYKGHTPQTMQEANYGMASPHGYRFALRLMQLAERFNMPVITLVDTVGAWPTFDCESDGQSEAIGTHSLTHSLLTYLLTYLLAYLLTCLLTHSATNLTIMAGLTVPIITIMVGEGGSGGALGICMGNTIGMLSGGYFGVISPEGAYSPTHSLTHSLTHLLTHSLTHLLTHSLIRCCIYSW
jgi:acetyl-CoA carboxylase alpha subunit